MARGLEDRRYHRNRKINARRKLLQSITDCRYKHDESYLPDGMFENNNMVNKYAPGHVKTNTRRSHTSYKYKGAYGKAKKYSARDQRQILREKDDYDDIL